MSLTVNVTVQRGCVDLIYKSLGRDYVVHVSTTAPNETEESMVFRDEGIRQIVRDVAD